MSGIGWAAALATDGDPLPLQLGQQPDRLRRPIEDEHGHVEDAAERHQPARVAKRGEPALDESDVDLGLRITQALEIFQRTL